MKILYLLLMLHCSAQSITVQVTSSSDYLVNAKAHQKYSVKLLSLPSNTYGYEIYADKKLFIRQVTIPGMPGNKGFQRKADAEKIAKLVIAKLSKGIMPPTVDHKEMDQLHIKY